MKKNTLNLNNVRSDEQKKRMETAISEKLCPFCGEGIKLIHKKPILKKTKNFLFTESAFPYDGTSHHFLILAKKHITNLQKVTSEMWIEIGMLVKYTEKKYKIEGGGIFLRFGDLQKNGSSIDHLHFHIISGNSSEVAREDKRESIKVKLGYKRK